MRTGPFHLVYCSNIHPGESWAEVYGNLTTYLPEIRDKLSWRGPLGIGLRLSAEAAETLARPGELSSFRRFLSSGPYYVATINGFPYGPFHGEPVKEQVYLPDWLDEERLLYTNRLPTILAELPGELETARSVSTVPGAFKECVRSDGEVREMAERMLRHVLFLSALEATTGRTVTLALEPEPMCYLETWVKPSPSFATTCSTRRLSGVWRRRLTSR